MTVRRVLLLLAGACLMHAAWAQTPAVPGGDYRGQLGPLHLRLHLGTGPDGALTGVRDRRRPAGAAVGY